MITVIKLIPPGIEKLRYTGEVITRTPDSTLIQAYWTLAARDLGYTRFEPGDSFVEHYYSDHWFNIQAVSSADGVHKGWYCDIAEPARITDERIELLDLFLDVWVDPAGHFLILDEDEFMAATVLTEQQRQGAQAGLQQLLQFLAHRQGAFSDLGQ